jgi:hypothetical protein
LPTPRANEPGSTSVGYGDSLNDFANRVVNGYARKDLELLRTPVASEAEGGAVAPDVAKANGQTLRLSGQMIDMVAPDQLPKLPTPTVSDQYTANLASTQQKPGSMHSVTLAQVFHKPDLFPTPNTMDSLPPRSGEARERNLHRGNSKSRRTSSGNLREDVVYLLPQPQLLPTPTTQDNSGICRDHGGDLLHEIICGCPRSARKPELFPTPVASEGVKATAAQGSEEKKLTGQVWLTNIAHDLATENGLPTPQRQLPTPTASDWKGPNHSGSGSASSRGIATVADQVKLFNTPTTMDAKATNNPEIAQKFLDQGRQTCLTYDVATNWGKFEPAIRRWEATIGRQAPEPTKPDGKEGNHRLSSKFTEWMMGLPDGWITDIGLKRNDELKACGNGVVPQQAELALSLLGIKEILDR